MRLLGVRCKSCGVLFRTPLMVPTYGRPRLPSLPWACSSCAVSASYGEADYVELPG